MQIFPSLPADYHAASAWKELQALSTPTPNFRMCTYTIRPRSFGLFCHCPSSGPLSPANVHHAAITAGLSCLTLFLFGKPGFNTGTSYKRPAARQAPETPNSLERTPGLRLLFTFSVLPDPGLTHPAVTGETVHGLSLLTMSI